MHNLEHSKVCKRKPPEWNKRANKTTLLQLYLTRPAQISQTEGMDQVKHHKGLAQKNEGQCTGSTWWHAGMQGLAAPDAAARTHENPAVRAGFGRAPLGQGRDARIGNNPILIPLYLVKYTQQ